MKIKVLSIKQFSTFEFANLEDFKDWVELTSEKKFYLSRLKNKLSNSKKGWVVYGGFFIKRV